MDQKSQLMFVTGSDFLTCFRINDDGNLALIKTHLNQALIKTYLNLTHFHLSTTDF